MAILFHGVMMPPVQPVAGIPEPKFTPRTESGVAAEATPEKSSEPCPLYVPMPKPVLDKKESSVVKYCAGLYPSGHGGCVLRGECDSALADRKLEKEQWEQRVRTIRTKTAHANKDKLRQKMRAARKRDMATRLDKMNVEFPSYPSENARLTFARTSAAAGEDEDFQLAEHTVAFKAKRRTSVDDMSVPLAAQDVHSKPIGELGMVHNKVGGDFFMQRLKAVPYGGIKCDTSLADRLKVLRQRHKSRMQSEMRALSGDEDDNGRKRILSSKLADHRALLLNVFQNNTRLSQLYHDAEQKRNIMMTRLEVRKALMHLKLWPHTNEEKKAYEKAMQDALREEDDSSKDSSESSNSDGSEVCEDIGAEAYIRRRIPFDRFMELVFVLKKDFGVCRRLQAKADFEEFCEDGQRLTEEELFRVAEWAHIISSKSPYLRTEEAMKQVRDVVRQLVASAGGNPADGVDFDVFYTIYVELGTAIQMVKLMKSSELLRTFPIPDFLPAEFRAILCDLKCMFDQYDANGSDMLSKGELLCMASELGVACATKQERVQVEQTFRMADKDGNGELGFVEFLFFLTHMRAQIAEINLDRYKMLFAEFDRDDNGSLSYREAVMCLEHLGLHPRTKDEQIEFTLALEELCDEDSNSLGDTDFPTFVQNIREIVCANERRAQLLHAVDAGYTMNEARTMRMAFDKLYAPATEIGLAEVEQLLVHLQKKVDDVQLRELYYDHDENENKKIDFVEFVSLMRTQFPACTEVPQPPRIQLNLPGLTLPAQ